MADNLIIVDRSATPARIGYSDRFNVAVPFIDRHVAEGRGGNPAIVGAFGTVTYGELADRVSRCGNALRALGLTPGARVLMMVKDCPEFFYLFWGAIKAGFVPVPLNTLLRAPDYAFMIEDSGCDAVVYSPEFAGEVESALEKARTRPAHVLKTEGPGGLAALIDAASADLEPAPATAEDDCFWLYSSGSTGRPKGVVHAHRDIPATCVHYAAGVLGIDETDICFSAAKLFFAYGLGNAMTFPLWAGATAVLSDARPSPDMTFDIIAKFRPTLYFGVPTLYAAQLQALDAKSPDLSSLRLCVSAGEALPAGIFNRWKEKTGLVILDGIGSTEILHIFISNAPDDYRPGASGRTVPGYAAKILDENGDEIGGTDSGALWIKGDSVAKCYWNNPERTAETIRDGWIDTGDTYIRDADGYFIYCGRNDDMMKVGGIWCSPFEIEARLIEHAAVLEAAVVGRADADSLIKPEAFVVLKDGETAAASLEKALLDHCKGGLAPYKYPRWFNFVDALPKTATGKIQRFKLRSQVP
ncbi:MAG: benzoate-CoA ligase family protein [Alphaproteobacteria bacterium]|nr:benzoate-CoA ligase family protein [Alphaproteobacteria bacterium]